MTVEDQRGSEGSCGLSPDPALSALRSLQGLVDQLKALDIAKVNGPRAPQVRAIAENIAVCLSALFGEHSAVYRRLIVAKEIDDTDYTPIVASVGPIPTAPIHVIREGVARGRTRAIALLQAEIDELKGQSHPVESTQPNSLGRGERVDLSKDVFIVHGRDDNAKNLVALFLERAGLNPVILHEQVNAGQTIIEKFEAHGSAAGFAIALLTPDDVGGLSATQLRPRARQNVIGELFWFAGKLGRNRVCALVRGDIEIPSDIAGFVYTSFDDLGRWKSELARELGRFYEIDWKNALK